MSKKAHSKIRSGLEDALAFAKGDESRAVVHRWHIVSGRKVKIDWSDDDCGWIATVPSLPGCSAFGASEAGAAREASNAIRAWTVACVAAGNPIPPKDWQPRKQKNPPSAKPNGFKVSSGTR